jgi:hypothetical protein
LDRAALARILKESLGIERPTRSITVVRSRHPDEAPPGPSSPTAEDATPVPAADLVLSGKLSEMPFADLVQVLFLQQKTGALRLGQDGTQVGVVYFQAGEVVHAASRDVPDGEDAFRHCAGLGEAFFAFTTEPAPARTIERHTQAVLLDAMRAVDEGDAPAPAA